MKKLKTLNDFKKYNVDICKHNPPVERCCCSDEDTVRIDELKAEAVKWYHRSDDNKHKFIKEFFNITEEELCSEEDLK